MLARPFRGKLADFTRIGKEADRLATLFQHGHFGQGIIPAGFEFPGHQAVFGIDLIVLLLC